MATATSTQNTKYWLEPLLAFLVFWLVLANSNTWPTLQFFIDVAILISAALSSRFPRSTALVSVLLLLAKFFIPSYLISIAGIALFINLFAAMRLRFTLRSLVSIALVATVYSVMVFHATRTPEDQLATLAVVTGLLALSAIGGLLQRLTAEQLSQEQLLANQRLAKLRQELARELHDTVAQSLSHAAMRARLAATEPNVPAETKSELEAVAEDCSGAAQDLRQLLSALRDPTGDPEPVAAENSTNRQTLHQAVAEQAQRLREAGLKVTTNIEVAKISPARATTLSKILLEASTNIIKHAPPGGKCSLDITQTRTALVATFSNDVVPSAEHSEPGLGLMGIAERSRLLNGTSESYLDDGQWVLVITLPIP
ncbi:MAG: hypothetical protein CSA64_03625 [Arachnia propionica]|nr:MAG: hypothetical protein CSA64_03625 [Arachnia propionica]